MKALRLALSLIVTLCLCGCFAQTERQQEIVNPATIEQDEELPVQVQKRKFVVGLSWQGMTPYVQRVEKSLIKLISQTDYEIELMIMDGQENYEKQISQVESFIAHKADVILLNPSSYNDLGPAITAATDAKIPIITIITSVREQELCTSFVGSDHKESAVLESKMAAQYLEGRGNIVVLEGTVGIEAQLARSEGYAEVLHKYPNIHVVSTQPAFWQTNEAYMITENLIYNQVKMDAILSQNDSMALGALVAVQEAGLQNEIMVFGIDGDIEAVESVREGGLVGTVFMDAATQAKWIVHCINKIWAGEQPEKEYLVPFIVMNRNNINDDSIQQRLAD